MTLKEIFADVMGIRQDEVTDGISRELNEVWDSFNHLVLMGEVEKHLGVKFTMKEIETTKDYGTLRKMVEERGGKND